MAPRHGSRASSEAAVTSNWPPSAPAIFDQMFELMTCQDLDLIMEPGQSLASFAAACIAPAHIPLAIKTLDMLLNGRLSPAGLKGWLRRKGRSLHFKKSQDAPAFLRELRDHLAA